MSIKSTLRILMATYAFCCTIFSRDVHAQLPQCGKIYMNFGPFVVNGSVQPPSDSIFTYDPTLPVNATNPSLNSILLPSQNGGLTVSKVLGSSNSTLTFYTVVNLKYWFFNPATNAWVNTNHSTGTFNTINIGAGGGFIYSLAGLGFAPSMYKYDGTGDAVFLTNISAPRPFDVAVDCDGNFYVISLIGPMWNMTKYNSAGSIVQGYTVSNPSNFSLSGGLAIMGDKLYADDHTSNGIAIASITNTAVTFNTVTNTIPYTSSGHSVGDFGNCPWDPSGILPTLNITASDSIVCPGTTVTFSSTASGGGGAPQFQWLVNGVPVAGATNSTLSYTPSDNDSVQLQMTGNGGCSNITVISTAIVMHVRPAASAHFTMPEKACIGDTVVVVIDTPANTNYQWNFGGGTIINGFGAGPFEIVWTTAGNHIVTVQAGQGACLSNASKNITILNKPSITLHTATGNVCAGDTIKINATSAIENRIAWLPGSNYTLVDTSEDSTWVVIGQSTLISASATDMFGCSNLASITIATHPCCRLQMPNAFSPNGDNDNDVFTPFPGMHMQLSSFIITNRWGQVVYDVKEGPIRWDGTFNGKPVDMATYFYYARYHCDGSTAIQELKGDLTLIR